MADAGFDDVERALPIMGNRINRYSGKWNMHFYGAPDPQDMLTHFRAELEWIFRQCGEHRDWFVGPLPETV